MRGRRLPASGSRLPGSLATSLATLVVVLIGSAAGFTQERPDRSKPPALGPVARLTLPPIEKRALANGVPVWVVEAHEVPLVQVSLVVMAGSGDDPAGPVRRGQPDGGDAG